MEITNNNLQEKFQDYMDGKPIDWYLARVFYSQNGGLARRTGDNERAIGLSQKDGAIVIDYIHLKEDEDLESGLEATVEDTIELSLQTPEEHGKLSYLVDYAYQTSKEVSLNDPEHQESMIS